MAFESGKAGVTKGERTNLDRMAGWDCEEDLGTINTVDCALTSGTMGDYSGAGTGVGGGQSRANYYCFGMHNITSSAMTIKYENVKGGSGKSFTTYIPAGGWVMPMVRITKIKGTGAGTTAAGLKLLYKDKYAIDETNSIQSITE
jgi:hypothetical protein